MENKKFKCEICKKLFEINWNKNQHVKIAHGEAKNFACNVCSKTFGLLMLKSIMKEKEITNVILVENASIHQAVSRNTC